MKKTLIFTLSFLVLFSFFSYTQATTKTLYSWVKDAAGNISTYVISTVDITLPPQITEIFSDNWEDGIDILNAPNHWRFAERIDSSRFTILNDSGAREGTHYARFEVQPGDHDVGNLTQERTEIYGPRGADNNTIYLTENSGIMQFDFSTKLDSTWTPIPVVNGSGWGIVFQIHPPAEITPSNPLFALSATDKFRLNMRVGDFMVNPNVKNDLSNGSLNIGQWIDWRIIIKFSKLSDGYVTVNRRDEGESNYIEVFRKENTPTLQFNSSINGGSPGNNYVKFGLYRSVQTFTSILYNDGFKISKIIE